MAVSRLLSGSIAILCTPGHMYVDAVVFSHTKCVHMCRQEVYTQNDSREGSTDLRSWHILKLIRQGPQQTDDGV